MRSHDDDTPKGIGARPGPFVSPRDEAILRGTVGDSIDSLVDYMLANDVKGIHPLIMGEIEKRLIIKALVRSRGNKLRAAKMLGISRNTFQRKIRLLEELGDMNLGDREP